MFIFVSRGKKKKMSKTCFQVCRIIFFFKLSFDPIPYSFLGHVQPFGVSSFSTPLI
jgi:hypothetical protein